MATKVAYPTGVAVTFATGVGLSDISQMASGNGWSSATITARAGGGQAAATPIRSALTLIAICATLADSVSLPPAVGGQFLLVSNGGAAGAQIFPTPGADTINSIANATGIPLAAGKSILLFSPLVGAWFGVLSA
jgi:hypothetical protein